ncbi:hypothetical protein RRF57_009481 [Xylaria bambusicola]|uniref:Uncharacterized protein n=1 Tax=Xylaria bambusicola TaxID=326684 RepID=A0AAN7Z7V7_9PEZI
MGTSSRISLTYIGANSNETTADENPADGAATAESAIAPEHARLLSLYLFDMSNDEIDEASGRDAKKRKVKLDEILGCIHRRKVTLRERLIKGQYEPQMLGMRVHNMKKAAAAQVPKPPADVHNPPCDFLVPVQSKHPIKSKHNISDTVQSSHRYMTGNSIEDSQPDPHIAYKSTPIHQLHFPEALILSVKQNASKWQSKEHRPDLVFVVMRVVSSDVPDLHVFTSLGEATAHALHLISYKHPEAFALPQNNKDGETKAVKSEQGQGKGKGPKIVPSESSGSSPEDENPTLLIKEEDPELPPDFNNRGQLLLRDAPEPTYVFWGKYNIASFGLKMEFRRADGTAVRVSVHRKTLRKSARQTA